METGLPSAPVPICCYEKSWRFLVTPLRYAKSAAFVTYTGWAANGVLSAGLAI